MRKMELEMEAKMREREDQREERMFGMLNNIMVQLVGRRGPVNFPYQPNPQSPFMQPPPCEMPPHMSMSSTPYRPHSRPPPFSPTDED